MSTLHKNILAVLVSIFMVTGQSNSVCCSSEGKLKYPGNGIPYFSRDLEIRELREDIFKYAKNFRKTKCVGGKLEFDNVYNFKFISENRVYGDKFCIKVELSIISGSCYIIVGNLTYIISRNGIVLMDDDKVIYQKDSVSVRSIAINKFQDDNSSTSIYTDEKLLEVVKVDMDSPAKIELHLYDGCRGYVGPWMWLRGYL